MIKKLMILALGCSLVFSSYGAFEYFVGGTCNSKGTCKACKNCKYCKNCSKNGGSCSVCR